MVAIDHKGDIAKDFEYRNHGLHIFTEIKNGTRIVHGYYNSENNNNFGWNVPMVGTPQEVISDAIRFCAYQAARYENLVFDSTFCRYPTEKELRIYSKSNVV